jgi:nucleoside phosphorylase
MPTQILDSLADLEKGGTMGSNPPPRHRNDFETAVICALSIEADAVITVFDHTWEYSYGKLETDTNTYTAGRIGSHDVVLTYLPNMGKASAASVAANLRSSFRRVRLCLVVGICGGVPSYKRQGTVEEILLGDVIISTGIVQYDLARQLRDRAVRKDDPEHNLHGCSGRSGLFCQRLKEYMVASGCGRTLACISEEYAIKEAFRNRSILAADSVTEKQKGLKYILVALRQETWL